MIGANCVVMIGEVADLRTPSPKVMSLRLKVTESYINRDGELAQRSGSHKVTVFGERNVSFLSKAISVGSVVQVVGRLENRSYEDKNGIKKWETQISANDITPLQVASARRPSGEAGQADDDDLPF